MQGECRMYTNGDCIGLIRLECKGDYYNTEGKCPFYKDEQTYQMELRHKKHRLHKLGLDHLLRRKDHG